MLPAVKQLPLKGIGEANTGRRDAGLD
jgi:hypothetical protein